MTFGGKMVKTKQTQRKTGKGKFTESKSSRSRSSQKQNKTDAAASPHTTQGSVSPRPSTSHGVNDGTTDTSRSFIYNEKQMNSWKTIDKKMLDHLDQMINSNVKTICSKPHFVKNTDAQEKLTDLSRVLKAKLRRLKVPRANYGHYATIRDTLSRLHDEQDGNKDQIRELQQAIRIEERKIEELEEVSDATDIVIGLNLKVPSNQLDLPKFPYVT